MDAVLIYALDEAGTPQSSDGSFADAVHFVEVATRQKVQHFGQFLF